MTDVNGVTAPEQPFPVKRPATSTVSATRVASMAAIVPCSRRKWNVAVTRGEKVRKTNLNEMKI